MCIECGMGMTHVGCSEGEFAFFPMPFCGVLKYKEHAYTQSY